MYCPACGTRIIPENASFCFHCGQGIFATPEKQLADDTDRQATPITYDSNKATIKGDVGTGGGDFIGRDVHAGKSVILHLPQPGVYQILLSVTFMLLVGVIILEYRGSKNPEFPYTTGRLLQEMRKRLEKYASTPTPHPTLISTSTPTTTSSPTPTPMLSYLCQAEIKSDFGLSKVDRVYREPSGSSLKKPALTVGGTVEIREQSKGAEVWYHIWSIEGTKPELGWIASDDVRLSPTCPLSTNIPTSTPATLPVTHTLEFADNQSGATVRCGDIVDAEFTKNAEDQMYLLPMQPKESFEVAVEPAGGDLKTLIAIYGPSNLRIKITGVPSVSGNMYLVSQAPKLASGILSARGVYKILVTNTAIALAGQDMHNDTLITDSEALGGVGSYTLSIRCTEPDGSTIEPGDVPQLAPTATLLPTPVVQAAILTNTTVPFRGVGFPGLAPVDFSEVASIPLDLDTATAGVMPLDNRILGFTLDAKANDVLDLSYKRKSGNLNLGLVVLSATNKVVFQASLVTAESLATRFTLPEAGQYTIGVFRINLVNPEKPQPTAFQLLAKLNVK